MLIDPMSLQQLAQGAVQYSNLDARQWQEGNRTIVYTYDNNGSMTSKVTKKSSDSTVLETVTYQYNLQNKLARVVTVAAGFTEITEYKYDSVGNRVAKIVDGVTTKYLVDNANLTGYSQVFKETTSTDSTCYIIGDDVLAQATGNASTAPKYMLHDGHGSTRQLVNSAGASILESYSYDAYGVMLGGNPQTPVATNLLYAGEKWDTSAQHYYLRARYYDPLNGRFNSVDPFSGNLQEPQSLHKYLYTHCNPINRIDPTGCESLLSITMVISIASLILLSPTWVNAPGPGERVMKDNSGDMVVDLYVAMALLPVAIVGGKLVSALSQKYFRWTGKSTTIITTATGNAQIPARTIGNATFINPGPLEGELASTFSGGRYATVITEEPIYLYRAWHRGGSQEFGMFWSTSPPKGSIAAQIDSALLPQWGNKATEWTMIQVPKGTKLFVGEVASQGGIWVGGTPQIIIRDGAQSSWKIAEGTLK